MSHCSQCGRYVGPYEACPYCGTRMTGRISIRVVKGAAVGLATVGLLVLWLAATRSPIPQVQIGQVSATMNMAYARVEGWVVRGPEFYSDSGYLAFTVADDTGEVRVSAYRNETNQLLAQGRTPGLGDWVSVAGTLRVREEGVGLTLNVPEHLEIRRPEALEQEIAEINPSHRRLRVRVRGQVWAIRYPRAGLALVTLRDHTGAIDLSLDQTLAALSGHWPSLELGQPVAVVGTVDLYREDPQIVPASALDIVPLSEPVIIAPLVNVDGLTVNRVGRLVSIRGQVVEMEPFSAGTRFALDDGTGTVTVLLWQDLVESLEPSREPVLGAWMRILGEVAIYRDELEVIPERPVDVERLTEGDDALGVPRVTIAELAAVSPDEVVTVQGQVVAATGFSAGTKFTLDDGTGRVVLLIWFSIYDDLPHAEMLDLGAQVQVTGQLQLYEGTLQVVPRVPSEVMVQAPGALTLPMREVGSLTEADTGALVALEGAVTRMERFASGYRVWLGDGTGEVMVLLWESIIQRMPSLVSEPGTWLQVTGVVEMYQGVLEVVPRLPHDVRVIGE